jgi:hypothetical protein
MDGQSQFSQILNDCKLLANYTCHSVAVRGMVFTAEPRVDHVMMWTSWHVSRKLPSSFLFSVVIIIPNLRFIVSRPYPCRDSKLRLEGSNVPRPYAA